MSADPRDAFWNVSFETYYDAYYQELVANALISLWQKVDDITKACVALTMSGSAVAGWALWSQQGFRAAWTVIAGIAAVAAIMHAALGVPSRVKAWSDVRAVFSGLRVDLETLRQRMQVNAMFPLDEYEDTYAELRERYSRGIRSLPNDLLQRRGLDIAVQDQLDEKLGNEIIDDEGM